MRLFGNLKAISFFLALAVFADTSLVAQAASPAARAKGRTVAQSEGAGPAEGKPEAAAPGFKRDLRRRWIVPNAKQFDLTEETAAKVRAGQIESFEVRFDFSVDGCRTCIEPYMTVVHHRPGKPDTYLGGQLAGKIKDKNGNVIEVRGIRYKDYDETMLRLDAEEAELWSNTAKYTKYALTGIGTVAAGVALYRFAKFVQLPHVKRKLRKVWLDGLIPGVGEFFVKAHSLRRENRFQLTMAIIIEAGAAYNIFSGANKGLDKLIKGREAHERHLMKKTIAETYELALAFEDNVDLSEVDLLAWNEEEVLKNYEFGVNDKKIPIAEGMAETKEPVRIHDVIDVDEDAGFVQTAFNNFFNKYMIEANPSKEPVRK